MMNIFIKRSSITSSICKRALVSLTSAESFHQSAAELVSVARNRAFGGEIRDYVSSSFLLGVLGVRGFHSGSRPLDYKASVVSQARRAAAVQEVTSDDEDDIITASSEDGLKISKLGIANEIVQALAKKGIKSLFPIQKAVLEPAMQGRDMIARAKTGTGKTLAFGIPIMDKIIQYNAKHGKGKHPLALVLAPTRELARQVEKEFYESAPNLDTLCVYGGTPIQPQMSELKRGMDIVVGTPGRVTDLIKRGALNLSKVQFAVLDEADQMLAVGFVEAVGTIMNKLPEHRQSLMFSATMPTWIKKLTQRHLKNPLVIDLVGDDDQKLAEGITLYSIASDSRAKASILGPLITQHGKGGKCIIFTATKRDADRLSSALSRRMKCQALHGDITQQQREKTLSGFREGYFNVLCATDVASRGLDIPHVDLVIHFEAPNSSEIFVHRSGRTGRAGKKGTVILVHTDQQRRIVQQIEQEVGNKFKELPKISVASGDMLDIGGTGGSSSRFGSFGSNGGGGSGGYHSSDRSSSRGYSGSGRSGSSSSGRSGFGSGRSGSSSFGHSRSDESDSDNFGSFGGRSSGRSSSKSSSRKSW